VRVPHWVSPALLAGSLILLLAAGWVLTFKSEPSAVGRVGVALVFISGAWIGTAVVGGIASIGLIVKARWAASAAWLASVLMLLTVVGSWAGIIGLAGLISSRIAPKT
jgi:hypothetical protein